MTLHCVECGGQWDDGQEPDCVCDNDEGWVADQSDGDAGA